MNRRIDFSNLGGYPLAQEDLDWMQTSYRNAFASIASMLGDKVIISGMDEVGGNVNAGWVAIGGELLPFSAGAIGTGEIIIVETPTSLTFHDGNDKPVLFERIARFGSPGTYAYADFRRMHNIINFWQPGDIKTKVVDNAYIAANFDVNGYGQNNETGWRILSKAYPSAAGKVMVNIDSADADFDTAGKTGGAKTYTLLKANLPASGLKIQVPGGGNYFVNDTGGGGGLLSLKGDNDNSVANGYVMTENMGSGTAFDKMNPFFVVLKLIKL
jgi:hypothetical protein